MIELAFKNLYGRKIRTTLTILGIVTAMQLYIVLTGIINAYDKDIQSQISLMAGRIMVELKTNSHAASLPFDSKIPQDEAQKIWEIDGIDKNRSSMLLFKPIVANKTPGLPPIVMAVGVEKGKEAAYIGNVKVNGRNTFENENEAIVGAGVVKWAKDSTGNDIGNSIIINGNQYNIIGNLPSINSTIDSSLIISLTNAQKVFASEGFVSAAMITAMNTNDVNKIANLVVQKNKNLSTSTSKEIKESADEMLKSQRTFFSMTNNTIIVIAAFIIMLVMIMSVFERKKEIGTIKAIGASDAQITTMIIIESLMLSMAGGILALPVSVIFNKFLAFDIEPDINQWWKTIVVVVFIGIISGAWPAWAAQRVEPMESLRSE